MAVASEIDCIDSNVTRKPRSWLSYVALFYTKHQIHALQLSPLRRLAARATACAATARRPRSDTIRAMWSHCYDFFFLSLLPYRVDEVCTDHMRDISTSWSGSPPHMGRASRSSKHPSHLPALNAPSLPWETSPIPPIYSLRLTTPPASRLVSPSTRRPRPG
jgi:hypothetical protein